MLIIRKYMSYLLIISLFLSMLLTCCNFLTGEKFWKVNVSRLSEGENIKGVRVLRIQSRFISSINIIGDESIVEKIEKLIEYQRKVDFGFGRYWDGTVGVLREDEKYKKHYGKDMLPEEKNETELTEDKAMGSFKVRKLLWRSLRRKGYPGTRDNGINDSCYLCLPNLPEEQKGVRLSNGNSDFVVLVQPFPIMKNHITVASLEHAGGEAHKLRKKDVKFLLDLTEKSEKFKYFFNGPGIGGASIEGHLHFQGFNEEGEKNPIEEIKLDEIGEVNEVKVSKLNNKWPITTFVFEGKNNEEMLNLLWKWIDAFQQENNEKISFNILTKRAEGENRIRIYFIPRSNKKYKNFHAFGSIEMTGVMVAEESKEYEGYNNQDEIIEALKGTGFSQKASSVFEDSIEDPEEIIKQLRKIREGIE